jgi:hypothetical protein
MRDAPKLQKHRTLGKAPCLRVIRRTLATETYFQDALKGREQCRARCKRRARGATHAQEPASRMGKRGGDAHDLSVGNNTGASGTDWASVTSPPSACFD